MHGRQIVLAVLAVAVTVTSVGSAAPAAAKQRVGITMKNLPAGTFVFRPFQAGVLKRDSGTVHASAAHYTPRVVIRDGQRISIYKPVVWLLEGKRGTLTIREPANQWTQTGDAEIGVGTWKVVRGTGQYAGITGAGRSAHVGHNGGTGPWYAGQEGFVSRP
jgi:hypothetical protein